MPTLEDARPQSTVASKAEYSAAETISKPPEWRPLTRLGFRIAFIYFCGFMWLYGNDGIDFNAIVMWRGPGNMLNWPLNHVLLWTGRHIFHVKNMPPHWHVADRGDALGNWVLDQIFVVASLVGGVVWTAVAKLRRSTRTEYRTMLAWLRFFLRLSVGFFMIGYGMIKVFPLQMPPISLATLNQPVGQTTPHALLWSLIGLYPVYESMMGAVEVLAGTLVLFRRTALLGALITVFVMTNIVLYNFFFGVSVKLFALNLLLASIFIVLPDARPLIDFFWSHQPASQSGIWTPPLTRPAVRVYVRALEVLFIVASFTVNPLFDGVFWRHTVVVARVQSPLRGGWRVDSIHPATGPFVTPHGPATEFYVDTVERAVTRSADGSLWRTYLNVNPVAHTVWMNPFSGDTVTYSWQMPDANHLILTALPVKNTMSSQKGQNNEKSSSPVAPAVVTLARIPLPAHYRLFDSKFAFVSYY